MTRLQCGDDTFVFAHHLEPFQRLIVCHTDVLRTANILQVGVFWTDSRVVKTGRNGRRLQCLPRLLLDHICTCTLQDTWCTDGQGSTVLFVKFDTLTGSFSSVELNLFILNEWIEGTDRVRSTTDTCYDSIGELSVILLFKLFLNFLSDNTLEITDDGREWVRTDSRSDQVVCVAYVRDPVTHRLIDCILQSSLSGLDRNDLRTKGIHPEHIELLTFAVNSSHVNDALKSQHSTYGSSRNTVLSSSCLCNDTRLANTFRQ
mmetsp:Transcript_42448/g.102243  ORF Transcript_42448/g.102243 Transcript_42448/m.102243 type:complete len:260 (-) Transcript_42448:1324-2103(-)